jgi:ABC-type multidrug transport system fused ATPase/permease subunit
VPLVAKIAPKALGRGEKREERSGGAEIVFKKVELVYPTRKERPAIHELDLHIRPGEKVAFCGQSVVCLGASGLLGAS